MAYEITPTLGLRIDDNLTATAKANLRKIDAAFADQALVQDVDTVLQADRNIELRPDQAGDGGDIYLGTTTSPAGTVYVHATTLDLTGITLVGWQPTGIVNDQIAAGAAIEMSKILNLLDTLATFATTSDISDAINTHNLAYSHADIAHANRTALDNVAGVNTGDETTSSIKTKLGAATAMVDGYLTSSDWSAFNSAVPTHESTYPHDDYDAHLINTSNPHSVTKSQVGLDNVTNDQQLPIAGGTMTGQLGLDNQGMVFNIVDDFVGTPTEGTVWWNKDDHTLNLQGDVAGTTLQVGQENWLRAKNETGAPIPEGAVVYINGANTARPTIALAIATAAVTSDKVIGVVTHTIAHGDLGVVTTFGLVRGLTTNVDGDGISLADGDCIYLSSTTAGEWVKAKPHAPDHCIKVGQVINAGAGGSGNIFVSTHTGSHLQDLHDVNIETSLADRDTLEYDSLLGYWKNRADITQYTNEKTGFVDPGGLTVTYDSGTRKITITHATEIIYLMKNKRISLGASYVTGAHDSTLDKKYFLYFDGSGNDNWSDTFPGFDNGAYAAQVNYYTAYKFGIREPHGLMDWQTWEWLHRNMGTYKKSGAAVTGITIDSSTSLDNLRPAVSEAVVVDEDLPSTLPALADNSTYMRVHFAAGVAVFTSDVNIFPQNGTDMQYNANPISGTALAAMSAINRWVNIYGAAVPVTADAESQAYRFLWFTGQVQHTTLAAAQAESFNALYTGDLAATILPELVPFAQITFKKTTSASGTYNVQVDVTPVAITGTRSSLVSVSGAVPTSHAGLLDRSLADQHPASAITNTPTGYLSATDVQAAIDAIVAKTTPYTIALSWAGSAGAYSMAITAASHGKGLYPRVLVQEDLGGSSFVDVLPGSVVTDRATGNVTVNSTHNFSGVVIIS
jgi:hypothetical protein